MRADHFELGTIKDDQLRTNILSQFCLDFRRADESKIGICVHPKETFVVKPKEKHAVYICEVGLPKLQAESAITGIQVYVKIMQQNKLKGASGEEEPKKIAICTLSKDHAKVRLGMVITTEMELSHNAERKNVYFNAFEIKYRPVKTSRVMKTKTNQEMWVAEVKPSELIEFRPTAEGKIYNLLKVFSETTSEKDIQLYVQSKGGRKSVGTISKENPSTDCELQFDDSFKLSHSSPASTVVFWGYTTAYDVSTSFKLDDLTDDPSPFYRLQRPRRIVDGEHHAYQTLLAKKTSGADIKRVNLVPMPALAIRFPRGASL